MTLRLPPEVEDQLKQVTAAFDLDYRTPIMAVGVGHKLIGAPEDFRDMANRFAKEAGLTGEAYGIDPNTREFNLVEE